MGTGLPELDKLIGHAAAALTAAAAAPSALDALPRLTEAQDTLSRAIDEAMAAAVVDEGASIRQAGLHANLSENAVGPRLARTPALAPYAQDGRVTRASVERARYDAETGRPAPATDQPVQPLRFRRRTP